MTPFDLFYFICAVNETSFSFSGLVYPHYAERELEGHFLEALWVKYPRRRVPMTGAV